MVRRLLLTLSLSGAFVGCSDYNTFIPACRERWGRSIHITMRSRNITRDEELRAIQMWTDVGYTFSPDGHIGNVRVEDMTDKDELDNYLGVTFGELITLAPGSDGLILAHELGHVLGVPHTSDSSECSVMSASVCSPLTGWTATDLQLIDELDVCDLAADARDMNHI